MAERRRRGAPAAAKPGKPAPTPERPFSALEQAVSLKGRPELSGSPSGAFTYYLYCQAVRSLCHNAQDDPETIDVARIGVKRFLAAVAPRDPIEGMIAVQMVGLHDAAMECFRRGACPLRSGPP